MIQELTTLISNIGFPCAMCVLMFKYIREQQTALNETLMHLELTIQANKQATVELVERLKGGK